MVNPFSVKEIPVDGPFCDRTEELQALVSHGRNRANVVLYSPRRYGKTSLIKRVQADLEKNHGITAIYTDFFGIDSLEAVAAKIASNLYRFSYGKENIFRQLAAVLKTFRPVIKTDPIDNSITVSAEPVGKKGIMLLEETLVEFSKFASEYPPGFHIVFDEFQEITELPDSKAIEGIMRSHIQRQANVSYFFVGSRRRLLLDMFTQEKRPFYKSAIAVELPPLPETEAVGFIVERFRAGGKSCPVEIAGNIYRSVQGYPYYIQRIPYSIYEVAQGDIVTPDDYARGSREVLKEEKAYFEALLRVLSPQQIKLLRALSRESTGTPYAIPYISRHGLGSIGGIQGALKKLTALDYIEKDATGILHVTDPLFAVWIGEER